MKKRFLTTSIPLVVAKSPRKKTIKFLSLALKEGTDPQGIRPYSVASRAVSPPTLYHLGSNICKNYKNVVYYSCKDVVFFAVIPLYRRNSFFISLPPTVGLFSCLSVIYQDRNFNRSTLCSNVKVICSLKLQGKRPGYRPTGITHSDSFR